MLGSKYTMILLLNLTKHFNLFNAKGTSGCRLLNSFPNCISFHYYNCSSLNDYTAYLESLNYLCFETSFSFPTLIIITDASAISLRNIQAISTTYF